MLGNFSPCLESDFFFFLYIVSLGFKFNLNYVTVTDNADTGEEDGW